MSRGRGRGARGGTKKPQEMMFYEGKVRDPRAEDLPGAAWVSGWARGRSVEVFQRHLGSSGEGLWDHFESKIVFSELSLIHI